MSNGSLPQVDSQAAKILIIIGYLSAAIATVLITLNPATEFYPNIYYNLPNTVWILISISVFVTVIVLFFGFNYFLSLFLIGFNVCIFYVTPFVRTGLPYGRGDVLAQLGYLQTLSENAGFDPSDLSYPFTHLAVQSIHYVSGLTHSNIIVIYLPIIVLLYVLFTYLLSRMLFSGSRMRSLVALVALFPMFSSYTNQLMPNAVAMYLVIPLFYITIRCMIDNQVVWGMLVFIFFTVATISHPLVVFLLFHVFIFIIIVYFVEIKAHSQYRASIEGSLLAYRYLFMTVFLVVIFAAWVILSTNIWQGIFNSFVMFIQGIDQSATRTSDVGGRLSGLSTIEVIRLFIIRYGGQAVISILTVTGILTYVISLKSDLLEKNKLLILPPLFFWMIINAIYLFAGIIQPEVFFPPTRFVNMIYLTTPVFVAVTFYKLLQDQKGVVILLIIIILLGGLFGVSFYDGDYTTGASGQQTHAEIKGSEWIIEYKDKNIPVIGFGTPRYEQSILGTNVVRHDRRSEFPRSHDNWGRLPINLLTQEGRILTDELDEPRYMRISEPDYVRGLQDIITHQNEEKLAIETNKLYSNSQYRIYSNNIHV